MHVDDKSHVSTQGKILREQPKIFSAENKMDPGSDHPD